MDCLNPPIASQLDTGTIYLSGKSMFVKILKTTAEHFLNRLSQLPPLNYPLSAFYSTKAPRGSSILGLHIFPNYR